jgi:radical SAM/Cys-rich protein
LSTALQLLPTFNSRPFDRVLRSHGLAPLTADDVTWLQINVGKLCNQACNHCHVDAGPKRTEVMEGRTADRLIELMGTTPGLAIVDLTGGAPELNPHFRRLIEAATALGLHVVDRCNLTVLFEPGQEDLVEFLAENRVEIAASLPCYTLEYVDKQRGSGVFDKSIEALTRLNGAGFGIEGSGLTLDLVYNPGGPFLPPEQADLQAVYKTRLREDFGIEFSSLITITNMPISRFLHDLERSGRREEYEALLLQAFNPGTVEGLMCRHLVSVDWTGRLYDCDFNQMLELPLLDAVGARTIWDVESLQELAERPIAVASHCFGCTAGAGSSCGGALT